MKKKIGSALVVGSGISGIRSALDLAETGYQVTLIDKAPSLGGILSQLDYQFPTDGCGMCKMLPLVERDSSSQFCLRRGLFHENINIMLSTELKKLEGEPGTFRATLQQKPVFVDPGLCTGCGKCSDVCPVEVPDQFNAGLTYRKAVYLPVPHNIPNTYFVDISSCTMCGECEKICPTKAIDLRLEERKEFRILIVDDEFVVRDSLKEWLEDEGFQVTAAASGPEGLELLANENVNLMLLDIKMPGMDGIEVLKKAKETSPDLPVVMMTAYATVETAVEAMKTGALDYLMKPFDPESLVRIVSMLYQNIKRTGEFLLETGAVILAAGFESFDPSTGKNTYGYGELPNVVTSMEFERMMSGTGTYTGKITRPGDGKEAKKIAWLQCVGSRDHQLDADFCSSVCCMFAVKEAVLARQKSGGKIETSIFYMDMRTFGKDFQRYRDHAEKELGIHFTRSRVHSVEKAGNEGDLKLAYTDISGNSHEEIFDLVVLPAGQRPPRGTAELLDITGAEPDQWGFCRAKEFYSSRTTAEGVFLSGSFSGFRDISESLIQAGSASSAASRLIHSKGGSLAEDSRKEIIYRDVSREIPRTLAALCTCGNTLGEGLDIEEVISRIKTLGSVSNIRIIERICTREGWDELKAALKDSRTNRLLISACMPYSYTARLKELGRETGLNPALMDVIDIRTPSFQDQAGKKGQLENIICTTISMAAARLKGMDPLPPSARRIKQKGLVVGGGIAGMTSALAIADHGFQVDLIEKNSSLGGNMKSIHRTVDGLSPQELLKDITARTEKHPNVKVHTNSRVIHSLGRVGDFQTTIEDGDGVPQTIEHGIAILATGGSESTTESYSYGLSEAIMTQRELEKNMAHGTLDISSIKSVAMIQCVDSREEPRNYCSRICCSAALKNALYIKERNPVTDIYIFYRDIMTYGFLEAYYTRARKLGIIFVPYTVECKPCVSIDNGKTMLKALEPVLGREITIEPDLIVLSTGIIPEDTEELAELFGVETNEDGFFLEAESKWRPVDFIREGIFMAGLAHSPRSISESIASAEAAAQRSLRILDSDTIVSGRSTAEVRHSLCSLCERCIAACPYGARRHDDEEDRIVVDELMCQGCGSCAEVCPNSASILTGYRDQQLFDVIESALEEIC